MSTAPLMRVAEGLGTGLAPGPELGLDVGLDLDLGLDLETELEVELALLAVELELEQSAGRRQPAFAPTPPNAGRAVPTPRGPGGPDGSGSRTAGPADPVGVRSGGPSPGADGWARERSPPAYRR